MNLSLQARASQQLTLECLCQGALLSEANVDELILELSAGVAKVEAAVAASRSRSGHERGEQSASDTASMLKGAVFSLGMLPPSCCPAIMLITDGISELPESLVYDNSLMRLCRAGAPVIICPIGDPTMQFPPYGPLGFVQDWELLQVSPSLVDALVSLAPCAAHSKHYPGCTAARGRH